MFHLMRNAIGFPSNKTVPFILESGKTPSPSCDIFLANRTPSKNIHGATASFSNSTAFNSPFPIINSPDSDNYQLSIVNCPLVLSFLFLHLSCAASNISDQCTPVRPSKYRANSIGMRTRPESHLDTFAPDVPNSRAMLCCGILKFESIVIPQSKHYGFHNISSIESQPKS